MTAPPSASTSATPCCGSGGSNAATQVTWRPTRHDAHVFVAVGAADLEGGGPLAEGDAARLTDAGIARAVGGPRRCRGPDLGHRVGGAPAPAPVTCRP